MNRAVKDAVFVIQVHSSNVQVDFIKPDQLAQAVLKDAVLVHQKVNVTHALKDTMSKVIFVQNVMIHAKSAKMIQTLALLANLDTSSMISTDVKNALIIVINVLQLQLAENVHMNSFFLKMVLALLMLKFAQNALVQQMKIVSVVILDSTSHQF